MMTGAENERLARDEISLRTVAAIRTARMIALYWLLRIIFPALLFLVLAILPLAGYYLMFGGR